VSESTVPVLGSGLNVIGVRQSLGLSQSELGQILGITQATVSRWERGRTEPTPYQWGLLQAFAFAAMHPGTDNRLRLELGRGPVIALAFLLRTGITGLT
jgi:transcriptional regulator with XRE-family HTH domain